MSSRRLLPLFVAATILCAESNASSNDDQPFTIDDYFKLNRFTELALSSDGEMIAYVVESPSLEGNNTSRLVLISPTTAGAKVAKIDALQGGKNFSWIPGTHELAYLLRVKGTFQVFSTDTRTKRSRQHTYGDFPVTAFQFSSDGSSLAWLTRSNETPVSLYERLFHGNKGIVIDPDHTAIYQFVNPERPAPTPSSSNQLWIEQESVRTSERRPVPVPGETKSFYWSSDATNLSIVYVDNSVPRVQFSDKYTSIGVYDPSTKTFRPVLQGRSPSESTKAIYYSGGEWLPGENKLFVRRTVEDRVGWGQKTEWSVVDISKGAPPISEKYLWHRLAMYGRNAEPAFLPVNEGTAYSERTIRALPSLYVITPSGVKRSHILENIEGAISSVRFSADFETATFVNENPDRPPEVYVRRDDHGVTQLTHLNRAIADKTLPRVKEVVWQSNDGTPVQGWLLSPEDDTGRPWPLITFVHGGPTLAFTNEFAMYFYANGGIWPYPFEADVANGIAVFVPNYRGTATFGQEFKYPSAIDKEPVDDIISGIDYLVAEGVADPARMGICGQSHGAWLAALVMTQSKRFTAASFAEGTLNQIVNYNLMSGWLNRQVHDWLYGASLYNEPAKYIELSPDMHFRGLKTAVLFEAGVKSLALAMMGSVKAALYAGMPAEFVIYPRSSHNLRVPSLQKESAELNLDWFRFWLQSYEDPDREKAEQYARWRKMRLASEERAER